MSSDINEKQQFHNIRNLITDFQENQIAKQGVMITKNGVLNAPELIAERAAANKQYSAFSKMTDQLQDHLGLGSFKGAETFKNKLADIAPEDLFKKLSPKGNADVIPFLQQYFPDTLKKLQEAESKKFLAPAVYQEQGQTALDMAKLNRNLEKTLKGSPEYANFVLPPQAQQKIQAAQTLMDAIPKIKSSGTAGWMTKMMRHVPASAMAAIGFLVGHNPVSGYLLGELAEHLGRTVPDAMKLSYLKFLGADKPIQAEGFKAMVDMLHNGIRGRNMVLNATKDVMKTGGRVLATSQLPTSEDREKLDKFLIKANQNPTKLEALGNGNLGHYMPNHQAAFTQSTMTQVQYLQNLRPKPYQAGPLDTMIQPTPEQLARYHRALDIANNPAIILQKVKDGSIQPTDVQDISNLYPELYKQMSQDLGNEMTSRHADQEPIAYKTRMGISLFLGQPMDSSMQPMSIMAAQSVFLPKNPPPQPGPKMGKKGTTNLGKSNKTYQTTTQAAESDRSNRD